MTTYEMMLVLGSFTGALAVAAFLSLILERGSLRIFGTLFVITAGAFYLASQASEDGVSMRDLPPAISKLLDLVGVSRSE